MTSRHGAIASFEIQKPKEANPITPVPTETIAVKVTNDMADRRPGAPPRPVVTAPPRTTNASGSSDASPSQQEVRRRNVFRIRADSCGSTRGAFTGKKKKQAENNDEPSTSSGKKQKKKKNGKGDGKKTGAEISLVDAAALAMNDLNPSSSDLVFASLEEPTAAFRSPSMKDRKGVNSVNNNNKSSSIDRNHNREMSLQLDDLKNNTVDKYGKMSSLELSGSNDLIGHDISEFPDVEKGGPSPSPHQRTKQKKSDINHSKFENGGRKYQSTSSSPPPPPPSQHHHHQQNPKRNCHPVDKNPHQPQPYKINTSISFNFYNPFQQQQQQRTNTMGRCCIQIVMGPAGSGKSTYCHAIQDHCATMGRVRRRTVHVANLDPAAETFGYDVAFDIRDLICVDDVMSSLHLGPNGSLLYCMEYLLDNMDWLKDEMDEFGDDDYLILDCPGQLELYTHVPVMKRIVDAMRLWGYESSMASVFVVDATFVCDAEKFIAGALLSLSAMIALELPNVNILSKCDLVDEDTVERILDVESAAQLWSMEEERVTNGGSGAAASAAPSMGTVLSPSTTRLDERQRQRRRRQHRLTEMICSVLDDYTMVSFLPLNITDSESIDHVLMHVDHTIQYGEDLEVRGADFDDDQGGEDNDGE